MLKYLTIIYNRDRYEFIYLYYFFSIVHYILQKFLLPRLYSIITTKKKQQTKPYKNNFFIRLNLLCNVDLLVYLGTLKVLVKINPGHFILWTFPINVISFFHDLFN